jgi:hypothetical protein
MGEGFGVNGSARVYWDNHADEHRGQPRYYGFADVDGIRYRLTGWLESGPHEKHVRLTFRRDPPPRSNPCATSR